jgi:preprotein translocase subunit SecE
MNETSDMQPSSKKYWTIAILVLVALAFYVSAFFFLGGR